MTNEERERVLEEVRAVFAGAFCGQYPKNTYFSKSMTSGGGCETCGYGAEEGMSMEDVSAVIDWLKVNSVDPRNLNVLKA